MPEQRVSIERGTRRQGDEAEAARVVEAQMDVVLGLHQHVIVLVERVRLALGHQDAARHAEMHDHRRAVVEIEQDVLGAPADLLHPPSGHALRQILRQRDTQILAPRLDAPQPLAQEFCAQPAADGFDFG